MPFTDETSAGMTYNYMTSDQRNVARRTDVLSYETEPLEEDVTVAGPIECDLRVSTTGTDSDWVVKLVDRYPGTFPDPDPNPAASGWAATSSWCGASSSGRGSGTSPASRAGSPG
jgi:predicted acyl esterase